MRNEMFLDKFFYRLIAFYCAMTLSLCIALIML